MPPVAAVYILHCRDGTYYVGCTRDGNIDHRLDQHKERFGGEYTAARRPVELVWAEFFARYDDAIECERRIKHWSRAKKEALIRGDWDQIRQLAGNRRARLKRLRGD